MEFSFESYEKSIKNSLAKYIREKDYKGRYIELVLGLYEEAAEVTSPIRKSIKGNYHEKNIDIHHLQEELGDVLWYISQITFQLSSQLNDLHAYTLSKEYTLQNIAFNNLTKTHLNYIKELETNKTISISEYVKRVKETYRDNLNTLSQEERARFFCVGLIKEIGKVSELFGEHQINGYNLEFHKVQEKLGDALWYLTAISETFDLKLEQVAKSSIEKVYKRYSIDGTAIMSNSIALS